MDNIKRRYYILRPIHRMSIRSPVTQCFLLGTIFASLLGIETLRNSSAQWNFIVHFFLKSGNAADGRGRNSWWRRPKGDCLNHVGFGSRAIEAGTHSMARSMTTSSGCLMTRSFNRWHAQNRTFLFPCFSGLFTFAFACIDTFTLQSCVHQSYSYLNWMDSYCLICL